MAVLKDLIVHGRSRFVNGAQFNTINAESVGATEGIFNKLIATTLEAKEATIDDLTATNATVVGLLDVQGEMHTKSWSNSNIATIDGNFYITPTVVSADGADVTASGYTPTGTLTYSSGNYTQMTIAGTFDTSQLTLDDVSSIDWPANSYVIITGEVSVGKEWYPLGTIRGKLGASIAKGTGAAAKSITIVPIGTQIISGEVGNVSLTDGNGHKPSTLEAIRIAISETSGASLNSLKLRKIKISMTSRASGNDQYALGIYMTAMGSNKKTFLDIYGGSNKNGENVSQTINNITYQSGALAIPTVRIGNLLGLPMVGGVTPKGWGIYTNNGFFTGTIVARQGKIGNGNAAWTIGNDSNTGVAYIYTGTLGVSPSAYISTGYGTTSIADSGALTNNKKWVFTAGDKFGVTNEGDLYASNAKISGTITVGSGSTIDSGATIGGTTVLSDVVTNAAAGAQASEDLEEKADKIDSVYRTQQIYYRSIERIAEPLTIANNIWLSTSGTGYENWSLEMPSANKEEYNLSTDVEIDINKRYYTRSATTPYVYTLVDNPDSGLLNTYYELQIITYAYLYTEIQTQTVAQYDNGSDVECFCSVPVLDEGAYDATKYITKIDNYGIKIHSFDDSNGKIDKSNYVSIGTAGLQFFKGDTNESVATFGEFVQIGKSSNFHITLDVNDNNGELGFYQGDTKVAYINNNQLYITQSVVLQQMDLGIPVSKGGLGQWSWKVHANGQTPSRNNLNLKWIG